METTPTGECKQCKEGFSLIRFETNNQGSLNMRDYCQVFNNGSGCDKNTIELVKNELQCQACIETRYRISGNCVPVNVGGASKSQVPWCISPKYSGNQDRAECLSCDSNYHLIGNDATVCYPNSCKSVDSNGKCTQCSDNETDADGKFSSFYVKNELGECIKYGEEFSIYLKYCHRFNLSVGCTLCDDNRFLTK